MPTDRALPGRIAALASQIQDVADDATRFGFVRLGGLQLPGGWKGRSQELHLRAIDDARADVDSAAASLGGAVGELAEFQRAVEKRIEAEDEAARALVAAQQAQREVDQQQALPWTWPPRTS